MPNRDDARRPTIRERQLVFESQFSKLYRVTADFDSLSKEYVVTDLGPRAGVVVVIDGRVLLVRQHRLLIDDLSWEIPGGAVAEGEDPAAAAARECVEETGVECHDLQPLLGYHMSLDILHNPTSLFYSHRIGPVPVTHPVDPREAVGSEWVPLERCVDMIFSGQIEDSFSIIALFGYRAMPAAP